MDKKEMDDFVSLLRTFYTQHRRSMPWRLPTGVNETFDPYAILVSELMLQQTQVSRVIPKYEAFLTRFPDAKHLAKAPLADVLTAWQGLGYNRRAKYLWQAAQVIERDFGGTMPATISELVRLPGVGVNTAGAVAAYAFDQPVIFVETNIRTVFIRHFFGKQQGVSDKEIASLVAEALTVWREAAGSGPREFYWALMDYGSYLKTTVGNLSKQGKGYARQSAFIGSRRQIRGAVLRYLSEGPHTVRELRSLTKDDRTEAVCIGLEQEGLIHRKAGRLYLGV